MPEDDRYAGADNAKRGANIAHDMDQSCMDVEVNLPLISEHFGNVRVDCYSDHSSGYDKTALYVLRMLDSQYCLHCDERGDAKEERSIHQCGQDFTTAVTESVALVCW